MTPKRIGQLLVEQGFISEDQVDQVLEAQSTADTHRPFGEIAAEMFDLDRPLIEQMIADYVASHAPDAELAMERFEESAAQLVQAAEAWETLVLPIRVVAGRLRCATTYETLTEALDLLQHRTSLPLDIVLAEVGPLERFISERYDYEGVAC
jgi:type IV pilus assembly protein PilB